MRYFYPFLFLFIMSCTKPNSVLICGDHKCINKAEANQYFEDNLTIEIQIISKGKESRFDLVDLNIAENEPSIKVYKSKNNKVIKQLSKDEIKAKKAQLKKNKKKIRQEVKKNEISEDTNKKKIKKVITTHKSNNTSIDICLKLDKCDIDSITDYLTKISNERSFPNISIRE